MIYFYIEKMILISIALEKKDGKNKVIVVQGIFGYMGTDHTFILSVSEWIEKTEAIRLLVKRGKYGGSYAYKDIAFEFASAIRPVLRLKEAENDAKKIVGYLLTGIFETERCTI